MRVREGVYQVCERVGTKRVRERVGTKRVRESRVLCVRESLYECVVDVFARFVFAYVCGEWGVKCGRVFECWDESELG